MMLGLTKNPENYHVIVSENMFGDMFPTPCRTDRGLALHLGTFNPDSGVAVILSPHMVPPRNSRLRSVP
jgi:hypothetical protein